MGAPNLVNIKDLVSNDEKRLKLVGSNQELEGIKKELSKIAKNNPNLENAFLGFRLELKSIKKDKLFSPKMGGVTSYFYEYFNKNKDKSEDKIIAGILKMYPRDMDGYPLRFIGEVSFELASKVTNEFLKNRTHKLKLGALFLPDYQRNEHLPFDGIYKAIYSPSSRDPETEKKYISLMNKIQDQLYSKYSETYTDYGISTISKISPDVTNETSSDGSSDLYILGKSIIKNNNCKFYCQFAKNEAKELVPLISLKNEKSLINVQVFADVDNYLSHDHGNMYLKVKIENE